MWLNGLGKRLTDPDAMPEARIAPIRANVLRLKGFGAEPTKNLGVRCDVELDDEEYVARFDLDGAEDSFPAYFLPFQRDRITCLELSPDAGIEHFFSSATTGHTLFVTGTPERPTVYHASAYGTVAEDEGAEPTPAGNQLRAAYMDALFKLANVSEEPLLYKLRSPLPEEPEPEPGTRRGPGRAAASRSRRRSGAARPAVERIVIAGWLSRGRWVFCYQTNCAPTLELQGDAPYVAPLPLASSDP